MSSRQLTLAWAACLVVLAVGCGGCPSREEQAAGEDGGSDSIPDFGQFVVPSGRPVVGEEDDANRYPSTVTVRANAHRGPPHYRECSGVLLAPNLVLTAAHCVCKPSPGETIRFDGSGCAAEAKIEIHTYRRLSPTSDQSWRKSKLGKILVHPQFQIALDAQGGVVSSRADLALVRLEEPASDIQPVRLAAEDVEVGEVLSVVGYGFFAVQPGKEFGLDTTRVFNREKVQTPADGERFLFGSMEMADYKGDTGGPCLRETARGLELVGISQRGLGLTPTFTRIAPYRKWLEEQIRLAGERP